MGWDQDYLGKCGTKNEKKGRSHKHKAGGLESFALGKWSTADRLKQMDGLELHLPNLP